MRRQLCSLLLALTTLCGSTAALAANTATTAGTSSEATLSSTSVESADSQDPQAYREQHPKKVTQEQTISSVMLFANTTVKSIYTGNHYVLPAGAKITHGIDVSKWDSTINWTRVKSAGTDFAIIRVGYRGYGGGGLFADPTYTTNIKNANKAGVPAGVYIYSQATTQAEAREEAQYCINKVQGYNIQLPIVMDLEFAENSRGYTGRLYNKKLSKSAQTNICLAFCDTVRAAGYTPMIYANAFMLNEHTNASSLSATCPIWMASFPTSKTNVSSATYSTSYSGDYAIWQYSEWGHVDGIKPIIDCNFGIDLNIPGGRTGSSPVTTVEAEGVYLNKEQAELRKGKRLTLNASVTPSGATDALIWSSTNPSVATVSNGTVTGVSAGTTTIRASAGNFHASCSVTVTEVPAEQVTLNQNTVSLVKGKTTTLTAALDPLDSTDALKWTTSNSSVATVSDAGMVTAKAVGSATITAKAGNKQAECQVTVTPAKTTVTEMRRTASGIMLTWKASTGSNQYTIYRSATGISGSFQKIATTSSKTYTDKKAASGKTYYYQVAGQATASGKTYTGSASAALSTANIPTRSTIRSLKQQSGRKSKLTWSASKGAANYYILRSTTGKNGSFRRIKTVKTTTYTSGKQIRGKRYSYRVVPIRTIGSVVYRGQASATKNIRIR